MYERFLFGIFFMRSSISLPMYLVNTAVGTHLFGLGAVLELLFELTLEVLYLYGVGLLLGLLATELQFQGRLLRLQKVVLRLELRLVFLVKGERDEFRICLICSHIFTCVSSFFYK